MSTRFTRTFAVTSCAWFLFALDRLAVTTALPTIRSELGADLVGAEWTVNAYTLAFALLLIGGAALGDRFGRRRMFAVGIATFTAGSAAAALAPDVGTLVAARAVQGAGAAIFVPLAMTLLTVATPAERRGRALGAWAGIGGLGAALGPLLGGALTALAGWQSIFWINVPLGLALVALAGPCLAESRGPRTGLDLLPLRLFRSRAFTTANAVALLFYAALFGGLFLITQLIQVGLGATPLDAGLRLLPMAAMPMLLAPVGGALADRFGARPPMVLGVALVAAGAAGLAAGTAPGVTYGALVAPLFLMGAGSGLFFAPVVHAVLGAVPPHEHGTASGVSTTVRELAVVLGVTVLGAVFAAHGDLGSPARTLAGIAPALWLAAAIAGAGVPVALALLARPRSRSPIGDLPGSGAGRPARTECGAGVVAGSITVDPSVRAAGPQTTPRSARCSTSPTPPMPPMSTPPCGTATAPTCSTSTGTPVTASCASPSSTGKSSATRRSTPMPPPRASAGRPGGRAAADSPCTRATAAMASPPRSCASWSSAPASRARRSSPSTPLGSWAPHGRSTGGWATSGPRSSTAT